MKVHPKLFNTHILNSCFSRKAYATQKEATAEARRIAEWNKKKAESSGVEVWAGSYQMKSYECGFCKKFHLTNADQKRWNDGGRSGAKIKLRDTRKRAKKKNNKKR